MSNFRFPYLTFICLLLSYISASGQNSNSKGMVYDADPENVSYSEKHHAYIITIDSPGGQYQSDRYPRLSYATNDVYGIGNALNNGGSLSNYETSTNHYGNKRSTILYALSNPRSGQRDDLVIIAMSGHGALINGDYVFVANDGYIYGREIWSALSGLESKGLNVILFLDTCYSGMMKRNIPKTFTGKGRIALFCSCTSNEQSFEDSSKEMSRFSYSIASLFYGFADEYKNENLSVDFLQSEIYRSTSGQNPSVIPIGDFDSYYPFKRPVTYNDRMSEGYKLYRSGRYLDALRIYSKTKGLFNTLNKDVPELLENGIKNSIKGVQSDVNKIYNDSSKYNPSSTLRKLLQYEDAYRLYNTDENRCEYQLYCFNLYNSLNDIQNRDKCLSKGLKYDVKGLSVDEIDSKLDDARKLCDSGYFISAGNIYYDLSVKAKKFTSALRDLTYEYYKRSKDKSAAFEWCKSEWSKYHSSEWEKEADLYYNVPGYEQWKREVKKTHIGDTIYDLLFPWYENNVGLSVGNSKGIIPITLLYSGSFESVYELKYMVGVSISFPRKGFQPAQEDDSYVKSGLMVRGGICYSLVSLSVGIGYATIKNVTTQVGTISSGGVTMGNLYSDTKKSFALQPQITLYTPSIFYNKIQFFGAVGYNILPWFKSLNSWEFSVGITYDFNL